MARAQPNPRPAVSRCSAPFIIGYGGMCFSLGGASREATGAASVRGLYLGIRLFGCVCVFVFNRLIVRSYLDGGTSLLWSKFLSTV